MKKHNLKKYFYYYSKIKIFNFRFKNIYYFIKSQKMSQKNCVNVFSKYNIPEYLNF